MRKEVIFAIIFGGLIGGLLLYGLNFANQSVQKLASPTPTQQENTNLAESPTPTAAPTPTKAIQILQPEDESVVFNPETTIKGTSTPNTTLTYITENDSGFINTDPSGNFSIPTKLIPGENQISVILTQADLSTISAEVSVVYTTSNIEPLP